MAKLRALIMDRRVIAAAVGLGLLALAARRIGERNRSEARAISSIRAIVTAELAYASAKSGKYGMLECLVEPSCKPSGSRNTPFLEPSLAAMSDRDGYHFEFHPYPDPGPSERMPSMALTSFAVVAVPADAGTAHGRSFCGDDRQLIYTTEGGATPRVEGGRCVDTSKTLQ
jgi:hypothetical protein